jgi:GT2 family glycosyltransferase
VVSPEPGRDGEAPAHGMPMCEPTTLGGHRAGMTGRLVQSIRARRLAGPADAEQTQSSARMLNIDDLPVARTEIELSSTEDELVLAVESAEAPKIMALVRLHTHPIGVIFLDRRLGLLRRAHAANIWALLGKQINAHLAADGLPLADRLDDITSVPRPEPLRCERRRKNVLAHPPLISVVVATRDRPDLLRACLEALLQIDYPRYEIVVVDNDPTTDKAADLVARSFSPKVRYAREDQRGLAAAHNRGLQAAEGQFIAFVDDDVIVDRHWLTAIAEGFTAAVDVGCVTGLILPAQLETPAQLLLERHGGYDKGFELRIFDTGRNRPKDPLFPFTAGRLGSGANMAFDTKVLRSLGGFDQALGVGTFARGGDDLLGFFRVVVAGHQLVYQPSAVVWHQHHRDMAALPNQARGYGIGLGAFLTSAVLHEPRMLAALLRRLPAGFTYAFSPSSARNRGRYDGWPSELARLENRGLLAGSAAYAVSRGRTRRGAGQHEFKNPGVDMTRRISDALAGGRAVERRNW